MQQASDQQVPELTGAKLARGGHTAGGHRGGLGEWEGRGIGLVSEERKRRRGRSLAPKCKLRGKFLMRQKNALEFDSIIFQCSLLCPIIFANFLCFRFVCLVRFVRVWLVASKERRVDKEARKQRNQAHKQRSPQRENTQTHGHLCV